MTAALAFSALTYEPDLPRFNLPFARLPLDIQRQWLIRMAAFNLLPLVLVPLVFRRSRTRLVVALAAWATILAAQLAVGSPPNGGALIAYLAIGAIAALARDQKDLRSAIQAVACGAVVGYGFGGIPCTPIGEWLGPLVGIIIRLWTRPAARDLMAATAEPALTTGSASSC